MDIFTPKGFLMVGGIILLVVGILGFFALIGPTAADSIFGEYWYFDNGENVVHTILGLVALGAAYGLKNAQQQKWLVALVGIVALLFGAYSLFGPLPDGQTFMGSALQNPTDTILHVVVGIWGLIAAFRKPGMMASTSVPGSVTM